MIELSLDGAAGPTHVSIAGRALILLHPLLPTEAPSSKPENARPSRNIVIDLTRATL